MKNSKSSWSKLSCLASLGALVALLGGCGQQFQLGSPQDQAIVDTPKYETNDIRFVDQNDPDKSKSQLPLQRPWDTGLDKYAIKHNSPISITIDSIKIPPDLRAGGRDIAVLLSITTAPGQESAPLAVWFQRNVKPNQWLNVSNILVFNEPKWDSDYPPRMRVRVIDITELKNEETRLFLQQASGVAGIAASLISGPAASSLAQVAFNAATLVLASEKRESILDYTVQFYSTAQVAAAPGSRLTPIRAGGFVLIGQKTGEATPAQLASTNLHYDFLLREVVEKSQAGGTDAFAPLGLPNIKLSIVNAAAVVPDQVAIHSSTIFTLLEQSAQRNANEIAATAEKLRNSAFAWAAYEGLRRNRNLESLKKVCTLVNEGKYPGGKTAELLSADKDMLIRTLQTISKCSLPTKSAREDMCTGWSTNGAEFDTQRFVLTTGACT